VSHGRLGRHADRGIDDPDFLDLQSAALGLEADLRWLRQE